MMAMVAALGALLASVVLAGDRPGVPPADPWSCPASHPIKNYASVARGHVYYVPEDRYYEEASPERCYASREEAERDGSRPAGNDSARPAPMAGLRAPASR